MDKNNNCVERERFDILRHFFLCCCSDVAAATAAASTIEYELDILVYLKWFFDTRKVHYILTVHYVPIATL